MVVCVQFAVTTGEAGKPRTFLSPAELLSLSQGNPKPGVITDPSSNFSLHPAEVFSPGGAQEAYQSAAPNHLSVLLFDAKEQQFHSESSAELSAAHRICEAEPSDLRKRTYFDCLHPLVTKDMGCSHCQIKMFVFWLSCSFTTTIRWMPASVSGCSKPPSLFYPPPDI